MEGLRRRARTVPAVSSLPLQVMVYYNIQYALMYVVAILASHIHKVRLCKSIWTLPVMPAVGGAGLPGVHPRFVPLSCARVAVEELCLCVGSA